MWNRIVDFLCSWFLEIESLGLRYAGLNECILDRLCELRLARDDKLPADEADILDGHNEFQGTSTGFAFELFKPVQNQEASAKTGVVNQLRNAVVQCKGVGEFRLARLGELFGGEP